MRGKLLRRPLPPVKVDRPTTGPIIKQCDQNAVQPPIQYLALTSKDNLEPPEIQILDNDETSLPQNPPPSRVVLKSESFLDISSCGKLTPKRSKSTKHVESKSLFPARTTRTLATQGTMISRLYREEAKSNGQPNNLVLDIPKPKEVYKQIDYTDTKQINYSKHTHQKMTKLVAEKYLRQPSHLKVLDIPTEELGEVSRRVPQRQLLIELAALIKDHMKETMKIDIQTVIQPLPRFNFGASEIPETEIILYQQTQEGVPVTESTTKRAIDSFQQENRLAAIEPKFFQGGKYTSTPFSISNETVATPTEVAILDTLLCRRNELNLKAHFITYVPDISFLKEQVTSINISFNNFTTLPLPILQLVNLEVLKARDNPLSVIPAEICNLKNLKTLIISFCLLTTFPPQFFELEMLQNLDLSYNKLEHLPSQIAHLSSLQALGLEGNQLTLLPATILSLDLRYLSLKNNFTHPLFWQTTRKFYLGRKDVKSLKELSAVVVYNHNLSEELEKHIGHMLLTHCDYCNTAIGSNGFYDVKIHRKIFGHAALLYLYETCSLFCMEALR